MIVKEIMVSGDKPTGYAEGEDVEMHFSIFSENSDGDE